ncbi:MAG: carbohydrate binding domain-containing protein, partial [Sedimentisphaerales bacterium]|nr:carbohydrate binding domain-containing protein [Sedimentisphaerales bacterium]
VIRKVEFFEGANLLGEDLSSPYSFTWYSIPEGTYVLTAKATDSDGLSSISAPVTIYVGIALIVANGGFELGTGADANGWTENNYGNTGSIVRSSASPYSGSYSMLATVNWLSGTGTKGEIYQTTATGSITPGLSYDFGFVAKGTLGPGAVAWYQIQWLDTDGSHGGGVKGTTPLGNIWGTLTTTYKEYGATYTVPAGADAAMISIRLEGGAFSGSTGQMYIDDVYLY